MLEKFDGDTVRDAFGKALVRVAEQNSRIVLVSGDSEGASKTTRFEERFPARSFNLGIAEQNMVGFAAGMAHEGFCPYVSTRAPFLSMRSAEQVRTAVCYDNLSVTFVGTGGGCCSGAAGATHWALEDVAIMSSFGNMSVCETGDRVLIEKLIEKSVYWNGPLYIRLGRDRTDEIYDRKIDIRIGKAFEIKSGKDGYFICSGTTVNFALEAAMEMENIASIGVIDMFTLKPIDRQAIAKAAGTGRIVVAQDHNVIGGLGTLVGQVVLEENLCCKYQVLGCPDYFTPASPADYLYHKFGFDMNGLKRAMTKLL